MGVLNGGNLGGGRGGFRWFGLQGAVASCEGFLNE